MDKLTRRDLVKASAGAVAGLAALSAMPERLAAAVHTVRRGKQAARIRFAVIGGNHNHIYGQVGAATRGGGELVASTSASPSFAPSSRRRYPNVKAVADERAILEDKSIQLVLSSIVPIERAPLGVRVMQHGKDYMADKPGITTHGPARRSAARAGGDEAHLLDPVQRAPRGAGGGEGGRAREGRRDRHRHPDRRARPAPHVIRATRPEWFWDAKHYGGILCDIGSHQFDQFLYFTGSTSGEIVASQVRNVRHPEHPNVPGLRRRDGARQRRHGLHPHRLVHAGRPLDVGRRPRSPSSAPTATSSCESTSTSPGGPAATTSSSSTRRGRTTSTARDVETPYGTSARRRRRQSHRDGDAAGALLPRLRARHPRAGSGQGAEAGRAPGLSGR